MTKDIDRQDTREDWQSVRRLADKISKLGNGTEDGRSEGNMLGREIRAIADRNLRKKLDEQIQVRPFPPMLSGDKTTVTAEQGNAINNHCQSMFEEICRLERENESLLKNRSIV
jgi:hypothetical protein